MDLMLKLVGVLTWTDWASVIVLFCSWASYAFFAQRHSSATDSVLGATNAVRRQWMLQATHREVRVIDGVVIQNLSTSPSFFASTTIFIIGGLLAVLGATDKASDIVRDLPFAARTSTLVFDMKIMLLVGIYVYAFFRFTWSMRQYTFGALLVAAAPESETFIGHDADRAAFADKAGRVVGMAAETFNDGLRAYYFSFAAIGWFFSPVVCMVCTLGVVYVLYQREFKSDVLTVLRS